MGAELNNDKISSAPIDAATVILLRDGNVGLETLLLCRANSRTVMNSAWVFPGGKLDKADYEDTSSAGEQPQQPAELLNEPALESNKASALFVAACRETMEETGVKLYREHLVPWSRWITPNEPSMMKKRFDARFFVAKLPHGQTAVHDGSEATDSRWYSPHDALEAYISHDIVLAPPQVMSMLALCQHENTEACMEHARKSQTYHIHPEVIKSENGGRTLLYPGDPQHSNPEKTMPGPTRLIWQAGHFAPEAGFEKWMAGLKQ